MMIVTAVCEPFRLNSLLQRQKIQFNYWNTLWSSVSLSHYCGFIGSFCVNTSVEPQHPTACFKTEQRVNSLTHQCGLGQHFLPRKLQRFSAYREATQQFPTTCLKIDAFVTTGKDFCTAMLRSSYFIPSLVCSTVQFVKLEEHRRNFYENVFLFRAVADLMQQGIIKWNKSKQ